MTSHGMGARHFKESGGSAHGVNPNAPRRGGSHRSTQERRDHSKLSATKGHALYLEAFHHKDSRKIHSAHHGRTDHVRADQRNMYGASATRHTASSLDDEYLVIKAEIKAEKKAKRKRARAAKKRKAEKAAYEAEMAARGVEGGLAHEMPEHWGEPPAAQTRDYVSLPGGYGMGTFAVRGRSVATSAALLPYPSIVRSAVLHSFLSRLKLTRSPWHPPLDEYISMYKRLLHTGNVDCSTDGGG